MARPAADEPKQAETSAPEDRPAERVPARMWLLLITLAASAMMHGIDATVVTVASPTISREMHTGLAALLWVTTGYLLAYATTLVAAGKLGDRFGHRRVLLTGIVGFAISSALVGTAQSVGMLIAFRVVQGVFGASLLPSALAIVRLTFPASRLKFGIGVFMGTFALSSAAGPFLGGLVVQYAGWRWIFFINVIVGAIIFALCLVLIRPAVQGERDRSALDLPGILLLAIALGGLVLGINQTSTDSWTGTLPLACFAVTVVFAGLFVLRERTTAQPLLPPAMFRSRSLVSGCVLILIANGMNFAIWYYLSLFLQNVQGADPLRTGLEVLPIPVTGIVAAMLSGAVNQKLGARVPLLMGVGFGLVAYFGLSRVSPGTGYGWIWPLLVVLGCSMSFTVPVAIEVVVSSARKRLAGVASGLAETMASLGPAIGVAVVGTALALLIQDGLVARLVAAGVPAATAAQVGTHGQTIAQGAAVVPAGAAGPVSDAITRVAHDSFTSGLHAVLLVYMIVLIALVSLILLIKPSVTTEEEDSVSQAKEAAR